RRVLRPWRRAADRGTARAGRPRTGLTGVRVLVTGAGGYIGGAVLRALLAAGHEARAHVHREPRQVPAGVPVCVGDLRGDGDVGVGDGDGVESNGLATLLAGVDAVCHLAGLTQPRESWHRPLDYFAVNVGG